MIKKHLKSYIILYFIGLRKDLKNKVHRDCQGFSPLSETVLALKNTSVNWTTLLHFELSQTNITRINNIHIPNRNHAYPVK